MPFKKFCDLWFSCKSRSSEIVFVEVLHVSCMGWEVKIDMSGQSNDCLRVCNVKMKKFLMGQKQGTCQSRENVRFSFFFVTHKNF